MNILVMQSVPPSYRTQILLWQPAAEPWVRYSRVNSSPVHPVPWCELLCSNQTPQSACHTLGSPSWRRRMAQSLLPTPRGRGWWLFATWQNLLARALSSRRGTWDINGRDAGKQLDRKHLGQGTKYYLLDEMLKNKDISLQFTSSFSGRIRGNF